MSKVVETYKSDKTTLHEFRDFGSIVYDERILSFKGIDEISLSTIRGRIRIPIPVGKYREMPFKRIRGQCDLIKRGKALNLVAGSFFISFLSRTLSIPHRIDSY